ncbi:hypothetical protein C8J27_102212 [Rhodobacter aestuarii]|uniref:Cation/multidrug efflux pump n=1 Tax=Rhodobacter aestuarii TaxID=453582 RepID=A0A1N7NEM4_9RHOB|nr:hypothetical protein [Rhodobacter aestuarii]PTV96418.1 hypothetical protein C8J27_102212 [Rhodobacter aestuarii]SIS96815.1 hypothetical protein SAMN05421580_107212 [Rhodobacter aestuarii]
MIGFTRLLLIEAALAFVTYWALRLYITSRKREALENAWDRGEAGGAMEREPFIDVEMEAFKKSWVRRGLWLVVLVPYLVVGALIYFVN